MTVEAVYEDLRVWRIAINQLLRRQIGFRPPLMVPIATSNPTSFRQFHRKIAYAFGKFLRRVRVAKIDARQLKAAGHEMGMRVIKARQNGLTLRVDLFRICA